MKNKTIIIAIISFAMGALIYHLFTPVIFQEGNPWPEIKGIAQLIFSNAAIIKLSDSDNKYLTKSKGSWETVDRFLKSKGYEFTDQMGSGYFYKSPDSNIVMARRQYSRFYVIWVIVENKNNSLADELKECLPKSDTASHERCNELIKQITDYNSCVGAGFSIMKSNPPQCAIPDGRTFIQDN